MLSWRKLGLFFRCLPGCKAQRSYLSEIRPHHFMSALCSSALCRTMCCSV